MQYLHKFETDSAFEAEYNGEDYKEPWVSLTSENGEVNYNRKPSYLETLWETSGWTNPFPDKVLLNTVDGNEPPYAGEIEGCATEEWIGNERWYDITDCVGPDGIFRVYDSHTMTYEQLYDSAVTGVYFLWELDENGDFPDGWSSDEYEGDHEGVYATSKDYETNTQWEFWGTSIIQKVKIGDKCYGFGIYGD